MKKLKSIRESLNIVDDQPAKGKKSVNEAHVETDKMMYADVIAKEIQKQKTELNNLFQAEITDSSSDYETGNGGGRIKIIRPAVPDELEYHVELENIKDPTPSTNELGEEVPGDNVPEPIADVTISVSMNDGKMEQEKLKALPLAGLKEAVVTFVMAKTMEHYQKQKVNEAKVNEDAANLQAVAAGIAAVMASGVGIAGLMEYLKKHFPKAYDALSKTGGAAASGRKNYTAADEAKKPVPNITAKDFAAGIKKLGFEEFFKADWFEKKYAGLSNDAKIWLGGIFKDGDADEMKEWIKINKK